MLFTKPSPAAIQNIQVLGLLSGSMAASRPLPKTLSAEGNEPLPKASTAVVEPRTPTLPPSPDAANVATLSAAIEAMDRKKRTAPSKLHDVAIEVMENERKKKRAQEEHLEKQKLQVMKAKTMFEMVDDFETSTGTGKVLFLTNAQASTIANEQGSLQKLLDAFEIPRPKLVINLLRSWGLRESLHWYDAETYMTRPDLAGLVFNEPPFLNASDEVEIMEKLHAFMSDVILPLAVSTHALILTNAITGNCALSDALSRAYRLQRSKWGQTPPFTILSTTVQLSSLYSNTDPEAHWMAVKAKSKGWKFNEENIKSAIVDSGYANPESHQYDLDLAAHCLLLGDTVQRTAEGKLLFDNSPMRQLRTELARFLSKSLPTITLMTGWSKKVGGTGAASEALTESIHYALEQANAGSELVFIDLRQRVKPLQEPFKLPQREANLKKWERSRRQSASSLNADTVELDDFALGDVEPVVDSDEEQKVLPLKSLRIHRMSSQLEVREAREEHIRKGWEKHLKTCAKLLSKKSPVCESWDVCSIANAHRLLRESLDKRDNAASEADPFIDSPPLKVAIEIAQEERRHHVYDLTDQEDGHLVASLAIQIVEQYKADVLALRENTRDKSKSLSQRDLDKNNPLPETSKKSKRITKGKQEKKTIDPHDQPEYFDPTDCKLERVDRASRQTTKKDFVDDAKWRAAFEVMMKNQVSCIRTLLTCERFHSINIHLQDDARRKVNELVQADRLPKKNSLEGLLLLHQGWTDCDVANYLAGRYKTFAKALYFGQLLFGWAVVVCAQIDFKPFYPLARADIVFFLSILAGAVISFESVYKPRPKWKALRRGASSLESMIWRYRARVPPFQFTATANLRHPETVLCEKLNDWSNNLYASSDLSASTASREFPKYVEKHGQNIVDWPSQRKKNDGPNDDHYSPLQPQYYIDFRMLERMRFYRKRIPIYSLHVLMFKVILLFCTIASSILARFDQTAVVVTITALATTSTTWMEFIDAQSKLERYTIAVRLMTNLHNWWKNLSAVEKASMENISRLVLETEMIIADEQSAWMSSGDDLSLHKQNQKGREAAIDGKEGYASQYRSPFRKAKAEEDSKE